MFFFARSCLIILRSHDASTPLLLTLLLTLVLSLLSTFLLTLRLTTLLTLLLIPLQKLIHPVLVVGVVMISKISLQNKSNYRFKYTFSTPLVPDCHRTPRATAPRPPHTAALGVAAERTGAASQLDERRAWEGALPGTACSNPREKAGGGVSIVSGGVSSRHFFLVFFFLFPRVWKAFFPGMEHYHPRPHGDFCCVPGFFFCGTYICTEYNTTAASSAGYGL